MNSVVFTEPALNDLEQAYGWYELQLKGLGNKFLGQVFKKIDLIQRFPFAAPIDFKPHHKVVVNIFPYCIYYLVNQIPSKGKVTDNEIIISAVLHGRLDPKGIRRRLK